MTESRTIIVTLKKALRAHRITYKMISDRLGLSESSVKRLFSEQDFTLKRLDSICQMVDMTLSELFQLMEQERHLVHQLTLDQEKLLVSDLKLLLVAVCVTNNWTFNEIAESYLLSEHEIIRALAALDKLALIELLPNNRVKLLISADFSWIKNGPINEFFEAQVQKDFFSCRFNKPGEKRHFVSGMLSRASNAIISKKLDKLIHEFRQYDYQDQTLPLDDRFGTSLLMAIRPWELQAFEKFRKDNTKCF